jgi:hypothetical protein
MAGGLRVERFKSFLSKLFKMNGGQGRNRTADASLFRSALDEQRLSGTILTRRAPVLPLR